MQVLGGPQKSIRRAACGPRAVVCPPQSDSKTVHAKFRNDFIKVILIILLRIFPLTARISPRCKKDKNSSRLMKCSLDMKLK